jgi:hypothetical protein
MDYTFLSKVLESGGTLLILVGVLYWLFNNYIPRVQADNKEQIASMILSHKEQMDSLQKTFSDSI